MKNLTWYFFLKEQTNK